MRHSGALAALPFFGEAPELGVGVLEEHVERGAEMTGPLVCGIAGCAVFSPSRGSRRNAIPHGLETM